MSIFLYIVSVLFLVIGVVSIFRREHEYALAALAFSNAVLANARLAQLRSNGGERV